MKMMNTKTLIKKAMELMTTTLPKMKMMTKKLTKMMMMIAMMTMTKTLTKMKMIVLWRRLRLSCFSTPMPPRNHCNNSIMLLVFMVILVNAMMIMVILVNAMMMMVMTMIVVMMRPMMVKMNPNHHFVCALWGDIRGRKISINFTLQLNINCNVHLSNIAS